MHKVQLQKPDQYEITIKIGFYLSNKSRSTIGYQTSEVPLVNCVPVFLRERCIDVPAYVKPQVSPKTIRSTHEYGMVQNETLKIWNI